MDIGVIGLGAMGRAMAANLVAAGHAVKVWNRSGGEVAGATAVPTPQDALQGDAVLTMLSDDAALRAVLLAPGVLARASPRLIHVGCSTISVALSHELVRAHADVGIDYVAAPVLGRPDAAADAALNLLVAGEPSAIGRLAPLFTAIGRRVWDMGREPPAAHAAKLACNMMIAMAIESMAEAVALTEGHGVGRDRFFDLILNTLFGCRSYQTYAANIVQARYVPGFKAKLGLKDLGLAAQAAADTGADLPMLDAVHRQMGKAVAAGAGDRDWSALADFTLGAVDSREGR